MTNSNSDFLDIYVTRIALKVAPAVVCIVFCSGDKEIAWGSGFLIECDAVDGKFQTTVMTSATFLRVDGNLIDDLKVIVVLSDGEECDADVEAFDFHYNLAAIKVHVDHSVEIARLRHVDDFLMIDPGNSSTREATTFQLRRHSDLFQLYPGTKVIALGRCHNEPNYLMSYLGEFSIEQCRFDCKELMRSTCTIPKCGIGGPLVNRSGEVIGINFFSSEFTPSLPINIVSKWWGHYKKFGDYRRPWLGLELRNLYSATIDNLEKITRNFPDIRKGIIIDEVTQDSPAHSAGVHPDDIIVECDGQIVQSSLQFFDITWDKVGKMVELVVLRGDRSRVKSSIMVDIISPNQFNSWPLKRPRPDWSKMFS